MDMYNDTFMEHIVKRKKSALDTFIVAVSIFLGTVITLGLLVLTFFLSIALKELGSIVSTLAVAIIALAWYGVYKLFMLKNVEYEYILTNSEMEIDKIIAKRGRKHVLEWDFKNIDICASVDDSEHKYEYENPNAYEKLYDLTGNKEIGNVYFVDFVNEEHKKVRVLFQPTSKMLEAAAKYNKRNVFIK